MEKSFLKDEKKFVLARIKSHGKHFEILVSAEKAYEFKKTGKGLITNIIDSPAVFSDIKKGLKVKESELEECFGTNDIYQIAEKIIKDGELQIPISYKEEEREMKYRQIIDWLVSTCSNPQGIPYTPEKIKNAIEQAGVKIDERKGAEEQATNILKLIQKILPIKIATKRLALKVPSQFTGKIYGYLKDFILKEEWLSDGSLSCTIEIPSKLQSDFYDRLNSVTHGAAITQEI